MKKREKKDGRKATMRDVAHDLIRLKITKDTRMCDVQKMFYKVMKKHGIRQGEREGNGIAIANPEWSGAWMIVERMVSQFLSLEYVFEQPPSRLKAYDEA